MKPINLAGEYICVDVFQRPDGSYGFDEFRRAPEANRGWYNIGHFSDQRFASQEDALGQALAQVYWLQENLVQFPASSAVS